MSKRLLVALVVVLAGPVVAQPIVDLTVAERFGVARQDEPVRAGVPLAEGVAKDPAELGLQDAAGRDIPCQITPAMRWPDGSLRWVQMVFKATVPANGKTTVKLVKGKPASSADRLTVTEAGGAVSVQNGSVKLTVKGAGFNLFDSLAFDPDGTGNFKPLARGGDGVVADIGGKLFKSSLDQAGKLAVVEKGSESVVIKATGQLKDAAGAPALDYACWIHVHAGSPQIRVELAYTNCQGQQPADHLAVKDLSVVLPLAAKPTGYAIGGEGKVHAGSLSAGQTADICAVSSDQSIIRAGGQEIGQAKGKSAKPLTVGWADATTADGGLGVSVRWFWQMFPKSLQVAADGTVKIGLWSALASPDKPLDVYMGQGRTHYLTFLPHGRLSGEQVGTVLAARQAPLRAVASPQYYCRVAKAFGKAADSDPAIYPADLKDALKAYDDTLSKSLDAINKKIDGCTYQQVTMDSYGYMAWGDLFHWANKAGDPSPNNILWESNYYDYPWACILQFARTGDEKFLDVGDRNGLHLADVFMCKWHPQEKLRGACRYSPPANHVALDDAEFKPYVSVEFNHHKAQSILARYLLLGDLRARDDFLLALNNALKNPEGNWGQCRGPGAKLATLYYGYLLTGEQACVDRMKATAAGGIKCKDDPAKLSRQGKSGYFMMGVAMEGLLYYQWLTGDEEAGLTARAVCDFLMDGRGLQGPQLAYPLAFSYRLTGDAKYRDAAVKLLGKSGTEVRPKGFGMAWRSTPYAWYYLSNLAEKDKPATK